MVLRPTSKTPEAKALMKELANLIVAMSREQSDAYSRRIESEVPDWRKGAWQDKIRVAKDVQRSVVTRVRWDCTCGARMAVDWRRPVIRLCKRCGRHWKIALGDRPRSRISIHGRENLRFAAPPGPLD